jgi:hypothetical protein
MKAVVLITERRGEGHILLVGVPILPSSRLLDGKATAQQSSRALATL